ncbi:hypothetical protein GAO09_19370 [Rhizobiales bacterium RZME27]|uniref:Uncharacterized protein n=1 Tax=Endobacterium cereale TaxID=2663029 RepID=A0A6A8ABS2_9HYPH|nr:hypothetical protein [Endobacterium cereale]MQY48199.1 hypothetical protein [Endobacterium cereale]
MTKSVSLSVHRNKVENRRKRELAKDAKAQVEALIREKDVRAYAFVAIAADGTAYARWDTGAVLPMWAFADTVAHVLREDICQADVADDWRPNLTLKGGSPD